jgi:hypothetical protein
MLIELTPEQIVNFAETEYFCIGFSKRDGNSVCDGLTNFQIAVSGETIRSTRLTHEYRRKIGNKTVRIYSDNPLNQKELSLIVKNPFKFVDEHPFRH